MSKRFIRDAGLFVAGAFALAVGNKIYDNRNVACLVDTQDKVFTVQADGDIERNPMLVNRERGVCEPLSFGFADELPIITLEHYKGEGVSLPETFEL